LQKALSFYYVWTVAALQLQWRLTNLLKNGTIISSKEGIRLIHRCVLENLNQPNEKSPIFFVNLFLDKNTNFFWIKFLLLNSFEMNELSQNTLEEKDLNQRSLRKYTKQKSGVSCSRAFSNVKVSSVYSRNFFYYLISFSLM
jgi:hypothetical protein